MQSDISETPFPPIDDLHSTIRFDNDSGSIWLEQQRMLLLHASTLGALRKELIDTLGEEHARGVLVRMGWSSAQSDVELAKRIRGHQSIMDQFMIGPQLHTIEGIVRVDPVSLDFDVDKGTYYGEFIWSNSFEAEEHKRLYGMADKPVCWHLLGYACGYTSLFMNKPIYYKEVECVGKGDKCCRIVGKPAEEWDDAEELETIFSSQSLDDIISNLEFEVEQLKSIAGETLDPGNIIADSNEIQQTMYLLHKAAETDVTVLMLGETGVGKEIFSKALHEFGQKKDASFIAVNCAALPSELIESELFGVEKGAYTGADKQRKGRFERADGGTLFLDELGELSAQAQAKLLRVLQTGEFERVGGTKTIKVDVRLVAATNMDLQEEMKNGNFRADLYYRLNVFPITIPPLRDRKADLIGLVNKFINRYNRQHAKSVKGLTDDAMRRFHAYDWPGNIRELENIIERGVILTQNGCKIESSLICFNMPEPQNDSMTLSCDGALKSPDKECFIDSVLNVIASQDMDIEKLEQELLTKAYAKANANVLATARLLGLSGAQCRYRLKKIGLVS